MSLPKKLKSDSQQSEKSNGGIEDLQALDFTTKSRWTDFQLEVESKFLYVPKSHLALASPVFRRMFESDFKEKDFEVLPLPNKKYEDVLTFLKCTHPGGRLKITYDIIPKVLPQAHEYQVKWLLDDCTNVMLMEINNSIYSDKPASCFGPSFSATLPGTNRHISTTPLATKCCNICIMAEKYGLSCVIQRFVERFSTLNYKFYKDLSEFKEISTEVRYRILCGRLDSTEPNI